MEKLPVLYPMGAVGFDEKKHGSFWNDMSYIGERKYDGSRYLIRKENGIVTIVSRQPSVSTGLPVDKTDRVPHLAELFAERLPDGCVLDGEIITHENCESHEVTSIMGSDADKAIMKQEERGFVQYVMFDILYWKGKDLTNFKYIERRKALEKIYKEFLSPSKYLLLAPVYTHNKEEMYEEIVKNGGEGLMLKNINGAYEYSLDGKKPKKPKNNWIKVKKYKTFDVVIMGFTDSTMEYSGKDKDTWQYWFNPGMGDYSIKENTFAEHMERDGFIPVTKPFFHGWIGAIVFGQYKEGELVEIGQTSGIPDDVKQFMTENKESLIGKVIEVGAMRQNKSGALVHPRYLHMRDDKLPEQCILGVE